MGNLQLDKQTCELLKIKLEKLFLGEVFIFDALGNQTMGHNEQISSISNEILSAVLFKKNVIIDRIDESDVRAYFPIVAYGNIVGIALLIGKAETVNSVKGYVLTTIELITETYLINNKEELTNAKQEQFLNEWLFSPEEKRSENFFETAQMLGINLDTLRIATILQESKIDNSEVMILQKYLRKGEYVLRYSVDKVVVVSFVSFGIVERILRSIEVSGHDGEIFVGDPNIDINKSLISAQGVLEASKYLKEKKTVYNSDDVAFETSMLSMKNVHTVKKIREQLDKKDLRGEFKDTICEYFYADGNNVDVCESLCIHRNTLNYRLKKIETLTGKNPKSFRDLYLLYCAVNLIDED